MSDGTDVLAPAPPRIPAGRYHIATWGCQMNVHDSEKIAGSLEAQGYARASCLEKADLILLNTCSIREKASEKLFSELGRLKQLKRRNPELVIGVCGCVAQQEGRRIFSRAPYVDFVMGTRATRFLPTTLARIRAGDPQALRSVDTEYRNDSIEFPYDQIRREGMAGGKAFVTIIEGCNHRCTYCIVPTTRGREVCRPLEDVLAEVRLLAGRGILEVEFLGQTVNAYRDRAGHTLAELLVAAAEIEGIRRIRFTTSHPAQMTEPLMDAMAAAQPVVCPYLHLPVQSGSSRVLERMRRGYDREGYLRKIDALRSRIPGICFGGDVIVGFPGETEEDLERTLSLLDEVQYDTLYSFAYSPRPGTAARTFEEAVPEEQKLDRLRRLQEHQRRIQEARNARWIGRRVEVLVEGPSKRDPERWTGRTAHNRVVNFGGQARPGRLLSLKVSGATPYALQARGPESMA